VVRAVLAAIAGMRRNVLGAAMHTERRGSDYLETFTGNGGLNVICINTSTVQRDYNDSRWPFLIRSSSTLPDRG